MTEKKRFDYELDEIWGSEGITETIYVFDNEDDNWKFYVNSEVKADKLCKKLNEQQATISRLEEENEQLHKMYHNLGQAIVKTCNDLNKTEEVYLADFNICRRITEYEKELFDDE